MEQRKIKVYTAGYLYDDAQKLFYAAVESIGLQDLFEFASLRVSITNPLPLGEIIKRRIELIEECDVVLLPLRWEESEWAQLEMHYARLTKKIIVYPPTKQQQL